MEIPGVTSIGGSINAGGINDVAGGAGSIGDRHGVTRSDAARKSTLNSASAAASISAVLRRYGADVIRSSKHARTQSVHVGAPRENRRRRYRYDEQLFN